MSARRLAAVIELAGRTPARPGAARVRRVVRVDQRPLWPTPIPQAPHRQAQLLDDRLDHNQVAYFVTRTRKTNTIATNHQDYATTAEDLAALLRVYANTRQPISRLAAFDFINPGAGIPRDGRRREHKAWINRLLCLYRVACDAHQWNFLHETSHPEGQEPLAAVTPAGREWLDQYDRAQP